LFYFVSLGKLPQENGPRREKLDKKGVTEREGTKQEEREG